MKEKDYNKSVGTIINYKELSDFLLYDSVFYNDHDIIIDAPCGTGLLIDYLENHNKRIIGIDNSPAATIKNNKKSIITKL